MSKPALHLTGGFIRFHWKRLGLCLVLGLLAGFLWAGLTWNPYRDTALVYINLPDISGADLKGFTTYGGRVKLVTNDRTLKIIGRNLTPALATLETQNALDTLLKHINTVARDNPDRAAQADRNYALDQIRRLEKSTLNAQLQLETLRALASGEDGIRQVADKLKQDNYDIAVAYAAPITPANQANLARLVRLAVDAKQAEYDAMSNVLSELSARQAVLSSLARPATKPSDPALVLQPPGQPVGPVFNDAAIGVTFFILIALLIGVLLGVYDDFRHGQIRNLGRLRRQFGIPVLGSIPVAAPARTLQALDETANLVLAETLRSLFAAFRLKTLRGDTARVILMASPLRGDGKSSMTAWLAQTAARAGLRVCIVDADLRRPSMHLLFGAGNAKGLADYLSGVCGLGGVIYDRHETGIHLVTNRAMPHSAIGLLSSPRFETLLRHLREQYDLVLIDSPSCLGLSDAAIIAPLCDQVLMLARADAASYAHLNAALLPLQYDGATPISLVVTHVRPHHLYENAVFQGAAVYS